MADSNYNTIKPMESLTNIGGINDAKRRRERKKRQDSQRKNEEQHDLAEDKLYKSTKQDSDSKIPKEGQDENSIDYCA